MPWGSRRRHTRSRRGRPRKCAPTCGRWIAGAAAGTVPEDSVAGTPFLHSHTLGSQATRSITAPSWSLTFSKPMWKPSLHAAHDKEPDGGRKRMLGEGRVLPQSRR